MLAGFKVRQHSGPKSAIRPISSPQNHITCNILHSAANSFQGGSYLISLIGGEDKILVDCGSARKGNGAHIAIPSEWVYSNAGKNVLLFILPPKKAGTSSPSQGCSSGGRRSGNKVAIPIRGE